MPIFPDKKKAVNIILSKRRPDGSHSETEVATESDSDHDVYTACAEDMMAAMRSDSVKYLAQALKAFHDLVKEEDIEQDAGEYEGD
jgi:hypothetical protein